jgi:hypothetical protein
MPGQFRAVVGGLTEKGQPAIPGRTFRQQRMITDRLHDELDVGGEPEEASEAGPKAEGLFQLVARAKARWLRRIMYGSLATSTEKCFAYAVYEHLNCVTLDAWPGQQRLAELLGVRSIKTIQRAARGLAGLDVLMVTCSTKGFFRYAPVFLPGDEDRNVPKVGQKSPAARDTDVRESLLLIHLQSSIPTKRTPEEGHCHSYYRASQRGAIEVQIAAMLGDDGIDVLSKLGAVDDAIIERLCRAYSGGALGERELIAASLAAKQVS